tara:strand:- start:2988 stop:3341 length:354 start_codon:yes stop_codon:yes gene_type:complete
MKKILSIRIIIFLAVAQASCEYNYEEETVDGSVNNCDIEVSYKDYIRPLIDNNCMPCHNGDGSEPFAPDLRTFNGVKGIAELVKEVTLSRRMPKTGSLTNEQIAAIGCWVDQGALNN